MASEPSLAGMPAMEFEPPSSGKPNICKRSFGWASKIKVPGQYQEHIGIGQARCRDPALAVDRIAIELAVVGSVEDEVAAEPADSDGACAANDDNVVITLARSGHQKFLAFCSSQSGGLLCKKAKSVCFFIVLQGNPRNSGLLNFFFQDIAYPDAALARDEFIHPGVTIPNLRTVKYKFLVLASVQIPDVSKLEGRLIAIDAVEPVARHEPEAVGGMASVFPYKLNRKKLMHVRL
ncbi:hypothetical protein NKI38_31300 [Mesorhizobium sp. M0621]